MADDRIIEANYNITEHFKYNDFKCPCCDMLKLIPRFYKHVEMLERMRLEAGFPIVVNSGYRCPRHNEIVGGRPKSQHLIFATDIRPAIEEHELDVMPHKIRQLYKIALDLDFNGIGLYKNFIHLDLRSDKARWRALNENDNNKRKKNNT